MERSDWLGFITTEQHQYPRTFVFFERVQQGSTTTKTWLPTTSPPSLLKQQFLPVGCFQRKEKCYSQNPFSRRVGSRRSALLNDIKNNRTMPFNNTAKKLLGVACCAIAVSSSLFCVLVGALWIF